MLSLVTAAEHQYRHDTWSRDRDQAILVAIRARHAALEDARAAQVAARPQPQPATWARPIGARLSTPEVCTTTACAVA
ncbi:MULTISPECIES: hypothetical protein [Microbacterium]|uniref:hypothetical protein n=1 Tax=Microbacterium TaxID=33882 RepID=UPI00146B0695|nr:MULTISPECIES: hypothetical protein [Microbacterium]